MPLDHPYADFLHRVKKPAQYVASERGTVRKDWSSVDCRMCLAFPDLYEIGMSHLGYRILYGILNRHPRLLAERAYAVWTDMEAELRAHDEPLRSLESARPLSDFDVVGFSLQYELTYTNILQMLDLGGIPRWSRERGDDDPLIVCGGPTATHGEPLSPFVDVFLIGDGEEKTAELMLTWASLRDAGVPRRERLVTIAKLGGFYVPSLYRREQDPDTGHFVVAGPKPEHPDVPFPIERAIVRDLKPYPFPHDGPVAATETIFDRVSVEIARGCTEGCRFCQAGMIYRPVRERDPQHIVDTIVAAVREGGYDEASLTSLSTADYSAITPLVHEVMRALDGERVNVSVSSLRAYGLSEAVLDDMKTQRAGGLTFAPEAGTQRMRDVINKNVTEAQLMETAERVFSRGWTKMKLYFMIGLPTEEDADVVGIVETGAKAAEVGRKTRGKRDAKVTVSVSTHVPKPHTPFQWCAMDDYDEILRKQGLLEDATRDQKRRKVQVQLRMHASQGSWLEGVLARGDVRLADVISDAYDAGARFDSWDERVKLEAWQQALEKHGVDTRLFLGTFPVHARLPWDHIDVGLEEGFLAKEYRKALKNRLSPPCGKVAGHFVHHTNLTEARAEKKRLVCYDCGIACDMSQMKEERLDFLGALGAETPRVTTAPTEDDLVRQPLGKVDQGEPVKLRMRFRKVGRAAFGSHLDLVRLFPRVFRRARLPLFYSQGYHPKAQMTFSPALGLGYASLAEYLELRLRARDLEIGEAELLARIQEAQLEGLEIDAARLLRPGDPALTKVLHEQCWVAAIQRSAGLDEAQLEERIAAARDGDGFRSMPLERTHPKKGTRVVDVATFLESVDTGGAEVLTAAGLRGLPLRFTTTFDPRDGSCKPTEVVRAILGEDVPARFVRAGLFARVSGRRVDPLDLDALRPAPAARAVATP